MENLQYQHNWLTDKHRIHTHISLKTWVRWFIVTLSVPPLSHTHIVEHVYTFGLIEFFTDWLIGWLIHWLTDKLISGRIDWLVSVSLDVIQDFIVFLLHLLSTLDVMRQLCAGQVCVYTACPQHLVTQWQLENIILWHNDAIRHHLMTQWHCQTPSVDTMIPSDTQLVTQSHCPTPNDYTIT